MAKIPLRDMLRQDIVWNAQFIDRTEQTICYNMQAEKMYLILLN